MLLNLIIHEYENKNCDLVAPALPDALVGEELSWAGRVYLNKKYNLIAARQAW